MPDADQIKQFLKGRDRFEDSFSDIPPAETTAPRIPSASSGPGFNAVTPRVQKFLEGAGYWDSAANAPLAGYKSLLYDENGQWKLPDYSDADYGKPVMQEDSLTRFTKDALEAGDYEEYKRRADLAAKVRTVPEGQYPADFDEETQRENFTARVKALNAGWHVNYAEGYGPAAIADPSVIMSTAGLVPRTEIHIHRIMGEGIVVKPEVILTDWMSAWTWLRHEEKKEFDRRQTQTFAEQDAARRAEETADPVGNPANHPATLQAVLGRLDAIEGDSTAADRITALEDVVKGNADRQAQEAAVLKSQVAVILERLDYLTVVVKAGK